MNRYQIYLNPKSVIAVEEIADQFETSRSEIIREAVDSLVAQYYKMATVLQRETAKDNPLLKLAGVEKSRSGHVAEEIDEIYRKD